MQVEMQKIEFLPKKLINLDLDFCISFLIIILDYNIVVTQFYFS